MTNDFNLWLAKARRVSLVVAVVSLIVSVVASFADHAQFFPSYLQAHLWVTGLGAGSLVLLMITHVVYSEWGYVSRRILEAGTRTLPLLAFLFLPVLCGLKVLYPWASHELGTDALMDHKAIYLSSHAFIFRAVLIWGTWIGLGTLLCRWSVMQDKTARAELNRPMRMLSGIGIVLYLLAATVASWDWLMSLEPTWFSSMAGPLFFVGQALTTFAFVVCILAVLTRFEPLKTVVKPSQYHSLGNLLFAFVLFWIYMTFSQFLIIWSGNLGEEISWYLDRSSTGWKLIAVALTVFHFALPFLLLLSRLTKLKSAYLAKIGAAILAVRTVDYFWQVAPSFLDGVKVHVLDVSLPVALGSLWFLAFLSGLRKQPLLAQHDPRFASLGEKEGSSHG